MFSFSSKTSITLLKQAALSENRDRALFAFTSRIYKNSKFTSFFTLFNLDKTKISSKIGQLFVILRILQHLVENHYLIILIYNIMPHFLISKTNLEENHFDFRIEPFLCHLNFASDQ